MTSTQAGKQDKRAAGQPNRLINETSTYLLQHAHNPVDWYPWGAEALDKARQEDKPILLSIGYAACHWCHVMEHESFEDKDTALLMNENFVCIKVDREERTDLDEIYMKAVQLMTGHGGWPMTVFLTTDLKPFYGGTYYPPEDRHGLPGFKRLLLALATVWKEQREDLTDSSNKIIEHVRAIDDVAGKEPGADLNYDLIDQSATRLLGLFDERWGGFGGAPKFPHSFSLDLALRCASPAYGGNKELSADCLSMVEKSLNCMAYGGIHDLLGGGFARYSVDREWLIPHFEKMLYDNALLCQTYLNAYLLCGRKFFAFVARGIIDFVLRELKNEQGAFYSSLDADSEGEEGKFYVWTPMQIKKVLGDEEGATFNETFGITPRGNFEQARSVIHFVHSVEETASRLGLSEDELYEKLAYYSSKLLPEREKRVRPGRDEKVLTSWNSLMISALVDGYRVLNEDKYLQAATAAANFILKQLMQDDRLLRTWGQGKAKLNGYLDDYAFFAQALLDLASVDADPKWYETAKKLADQITARFADQGEGEGELFYTSVDHEQLVTRPKSLYDGSIPSGTSVSASVFMRLAKLTGASRYEKQAVLLMQKYSGLVTRIPDQFSNLIGVIDFYLGQGPQIAVVLPEKETPEDKEMVLAVHQQYLPNKVAIVGKYKDKEGAKPDCPLLSDRKPIKQAPTAYICKNFTCDQPSNSVKTVAQKLKALANKAKASP